MPKNLTISEDAHITEAPREIIEEPHGTVLQSRSGISIDYAYQTEMQILSNSIEHKMMSQEQTHPH